MGLSLLLDTSCVFPFLPPVPEHAALIIPPIQDQMDSWKSNIFILDAGEINSVYP